MKMANGEFVLCLKQLANETRFVWPPDVPNVLGLSKQGGPKWRQSEALLVTLQTWFLFPRLPLPRRFRERPG